MINFNEKDPNKDNNLNNLKSFIKELSLDSNNSTIFNISINYNDGNNNNNYSFVNKNNLDNNQNNDYVPVNLNDSNSYELEPKSKDYNYNYDNNCTSNNTKTHHLNVQQDNTSSLETNYKNNNYSESNYLNKTSSIVNLDKYNYEEINNDTNTLNNNLNNPEFNKDDICNAYNTKFISKVIPEIDCEKKHGLTQFSTPFSDWTCNLCGDNKIFNEGSTLFGCRLCDYDVCPTCIKTYIKDNSNIFNCKVNNDIYYTSSFSIFKDGVNTNNILDYMECILNEDLLMETYINEDSPQDLYNTLDNDDDLSYNSFNTENTTGIELKNLLNCTKLVNYCNRGYEIENDIDKSCPICNEKYLNLDICRLNKKCKHFFHSHCIDKWYINNTNCPICNVNIEIN